MIRDLSRNLVSVNPLCHVPFPHPMNCQCRYPPPLSKSHNHGGSESCLSATAHVAQLSTSQSRSSFRADLTTTKVRQRAMFVLGRSRLLLLLLLLPHNSQGMDGCEGEFAQMWWRCGDVCNAAYPSRSCICGDTKIWYSEDKWCCGTNCTGGCLRLFPVNIGSKKYWIPKLSRLSIMSPFY